MAVFDNLDDVQTKFSGTICYYDDKAVLVKSASVPLEKPGQYFLGICALNGRAKPIELTDPKFRYRDYNLGYANVGVYSVWWYRRPIRQYSQGLKRNQMGYLTSGIMPDDSFNFARPYTAMLENSYPSIDDCQKLLVDQKAQVVAFHRDFALSQDIIHNDFILEYRSKKIGATTASRKLRLSKEANYLREALKEAIDV